MRFYLGAGNVKWLAEADVPLFITYKAFGKRTASLPKAIAPWALDSGAFTELINHGEWKMPTDEYVEGVRRLRDGVGMMDYACPQDWICSPPMLAATGKSIEYHQRMTVENFVHLSEIADDVVWMPALQGWTREDYDNHVIMYLDAGVDLTRFDLVGLGSIGLRQDDPIVGDIARHLKSDGIALHGFGVKMTGIKLYGDALASADSMAWSFTARYMFKPAMAECAEEFRRGEHPQSCMACLRYAKHWRERVVAATTVWDRLEANERMDLGVDTSRGDWQRTNIRTRHGVRGDAAGAKGYEKAAKTESMFDMPSDAAEEAVVEAEAVVPEPTEPLPIDEPPVVPPVPDPVPEPAEPPPADVVAHWDAGEGSLFPE